MDRRKVLKTGVAAGAATVIWSEPSIRGLARRPAYAAGGSGGVPTVITVPPPPDLISGLKFGNGSGGNGGLPQVVFSDAASGLTVTLIGPLADGSHDNAQVTAADVYTLRAEIDGCICTWTDVTATNIFRRGSEAIVANGALGADTAEIEYVFDAVAAGGIANDFNITNALQVSCV